MTGLTPKEYRLVRALDEVMWTYSTHFSDFSYTGTPMTVEFRKLFKQTYNESMRGVIVSSLKLRSKEKISLAAKEIGLDEFSGLCLIAIMTKRGKK